MLWVGVYHYDLFGTYVALWWLGVALGLFAALVHWPIKEQPAHRPALAPAQ